MHFYTHSDLFLFSSSCVFVCVCVSLYFVSTDKYIENIHNNRIDRIEIHIYTNETQDVKMEEWRKIFRIKWNETFFLLCKHTHKKNSIYSSGKNNLIFLPHSELNISISISFFLFFVEQFLILETMRMTLTTPTKFD